MDMDADMGRKNREMGQEEESGWWASDCPFCACRMPLLIAKQATACRTGLNLSSSIQCVRQCRPKYSVSIAVRGTVVDWV